MVASLTGERHVLPTLMAANALREDNWAVDHLGADMPGNELVSFCQDRDIDLAVITFLMPEVRGQAREVAEELRALGVRSLVGQPGESLFALRELARDLTIGMTTRPEES